MGAISSCSRFSRESWEIVSETNKAQESGFGRVLLLLGSLMSYLLLVPPVVLSLVFFPRSRALS